MSSAAGSNMKFQESSYSERDNWARTILSLVNEDQMPGEISLPCNDPSSSRLQLLKDIFGLDPFEEKLIAVLWVCAYSPEIRQMLLTAYPAIQHMSPLLVARLFGTDPVFHLSTESPLISWELVREQETLDGSMSLTIDPHIVAWLDDNNELDKCLLGIVNIIEPGFELESWKLEGYAREISACLKRQEQCRVYLDTNDEELAQAFASALARKLGVPTAKYDTASLAPDLIYRYAVRIQRQSFLDRSAPFFGPESLAATEPAHVATFPLQFIQGKPLIKSGGTERRAFPIKLPEMTNEDRRNIWLHHLPEVANWSEMELNDLTWRSQLSVSEIRHICTTKPENLDQVMARVGNIPGDNIGDLVQHVDSQFSWQDLVVPDEVERRLQEIVFEARDRSRLWENEEVRRLFPYGRGLTALFSGPPGSGKSMAAQVVANELGLDLLRVDLSAVVSKWVGETTQNLQKILGARSSQRAVLFFDEADALYGKRVNDVKDANDRYVNMDSGHLMVALENFDGIVLMASNLRANIDPAFIRRIRHTVEFSKPVAEARKRIWLGILRGMFGEDVDEELADGVDRLSKIEATGAQIKSTVLSSAFSIRNTGERISVRLLGELLCREMAKEGRGMSERELAKKLEEI